MDANRKPLNDFELIAVFGKQRPYFDRKPGACMKSVLEFPIPSKKIHPTEKPPALYRFLIERYCPPGGTVLDPTFGSGNSVFTAYEMGRNGIGIEKDDKFFEKAAKKLNDL
jgi:DNA modification methylase